MKTFYKKITVLTCVFAGSYQVTAQCSSTASLSTASNMFSVIRNGNHPVMADKALNTIIFIHRNDAGLFGGNSGQLRYDISTNAGTTWTTNVGLLNPLTTNLARYPNATLYNPTSNTNPANAYISYFCPTIDPLSSVWNGVVSGVNQLNGSGNTETYNQPVLVTGQIPHSLVRGAPGVFWSIDPYSFPYSYILYKGVWSNTLSDIVWSTAHTLTPTYVSTAAYGDYNIGFDPTGQIGWVSLLSHVATASNVALHPVLYKTTDGGNTWTGPIQVELGKMSCITSSIQSGSFASTNVEHDLVVDAQGNPHVLTTIGQGNNYAFNYNQWHAMFDITLKNGVWIAHKLADAKAAPITLGTSPDIAVQYLSPQAARSADGNKVFFTWTDNSTYTLGQQNSTPNLFGCALDITTGNWTQVKDFTACNSAANGLIYFPHLAPEVLEPSPNVFKLASVYGEMTTTGSLLLTARFNFLDNVTFSASEFTVPTPAATVTIAQAPQILFCPNSTVMINVANNPGDVLWSTGATTPSLTITSNTLTTFSVVAQVGCYSGTASIALTTLTMNATAGTGSICPGTSLTANVTGNALSYTWSPGNITGSNATIYPTNTVISVSGSGSGCVLTQTLPVNLFPQPTVSIAGSNSVCSGHQVNVTANGANTYVWTSGTTTVNGALFDLVAPGSGAFSASVTGTDVNGCVAGSNINFVVMPSPNLNANSSASVVCLGDAITIFATGATNYSLNGISFLTAISATPASTSTYVVTGEGGNGCTTTVGLAVQVNPLPTVTITPARSSFCKGEKIVLTASGADTYNWTHGGGSSTVQVNPINTTTFEVTGTSADQCTNTAVFNLVVNPCTGIDASAADQLISVTPNPAQDHFSVYSSEVQAVNMYDVNGRKVLSFAVGAGENKKITTEGVRPGIYFLRSTGQGGDTKVLKLIVE